MNIVVNRMENSKENILDIKRSRISFCDFIKKRHNFTMETKVF